MADKVFQLTEGLDCVKVGEGILKYLKIVQNLVAEGAPIPEGYFIHRIRERSVMTTTIAPKNFFGYRRTRKAYLPARSVSGIRCAFFRKYNLR